MDPDVKGSSDVKGNAADPDVSGNSDVKENAVDSDIRLFLVTRAPAYIRVPLKSRSAAFLFMSELHCKGKSSTL